MTNYSDIIYGTGEHPYNCGIYCEKCYAEKRSYEKKRNSERPEKCPLCEYSVSSQTLHNGEIVFYCRSKKCKWAEK